MRKTQGGFARNSVVLGLSATALAIAASLLVFYPRARAERASERGAKPAVVKATPKPSPPPFDKLSDAASAVATHQLALITAEIARLPDHPWAGRYCKGASIWLTLAPESGFVFHWHGCMNLYDQNYGAVDASPSDLRLDFTFPNKTKGIGFPPRLIPVQWGSRHYLIEPQAMECFCWEVNTGREPRSDMHGLFLLRDEDYKKPVSGLPVVPLEYRKFLLPHPIEAKIVSVQSRKERGRGEDWERVSNVTLNVGSSDGVSVGTAFFPSGDTASFFTTATVSAITGPHQCQAVVSQGEQVFSKKEIPQPRWTFSTRDGREN